MDMLTISKLDAKVGAGVNSCDAKMVTAATKPDGFKFKNGAFISLKEDLMVFFLKFNLVQKIEIPFRVCLPFSRFSSNQQYRYKFSNLLSTFSLDFDALLTRCLEGRYDLLVSLQCYICYDMYFIGIWALSSV